MRVALAAAIFATAACAGRRESPFPVGMYDVFSPADLKRLSGWGVDTIVTSAPDPKKFDELAREASRRGMTIVAFPDGLVANPPSRSWPVRAWHLFDEPDANRVPRGKVLDRAREIKLWDPGRAQSIVLGSAKSVSEYADATDIIMVDWYPVPHLPLESVGATVREVRRAVPTARPVWAVIQAFDWRDMPQGRSPRIGRFPTHAEVRFMAFDAVAHGAKGIFFYTFERPGRRTLLDEPELGQAVSRVSRELHEMAPVFGKGSAVSLPFLPDPDGPEARAWRYRGRDYILILNRKGKVYQKVPKEILEPGWRPLFEPRRNLKELLKEIKGSYYLRPYQILVLEGRLRLF